MDEKVMAMVIGQAKAVISSAYALTSVTRSMRRVCYKDLAEKAGRAAGSKHIIDFDDANDAAEKALIAHLMVIHADDTWARAMNVLTNLNCFVDIEKFPEFKGPYGAEEKDWNGESPIHRMERLIATFEDNIRTSE